MEGIIVMIKGEKNTSLSNVTAKIGVWSALAVVARLGKHLLVGPLQFINIPLLFTMLSGIMYGAEVGLGVGFLSFLVSDSFLGLGIWTIVDGSIAGFIGALWSKIPPRGRTSLFIFAYLSTLVYDIMTSWILYMVFGFGPLEALVVGILGLFIPVAGGGAIAIGPTTEAATALLLSILATKLVRKNT